MKLKALIVMMLGCICVAIAGVDRSTGQTNIDELARGQPTIDVVAEIPSTYNVEVYDSKSATTYGTVTSEGTLPGNIEVNRKERDVDTDARLLNKVYNIKHPARIKEHPSRKYKDRVGWRHQS